MVLDESPETVGNLQQVISQNPALIRSTPLAGNETMALDVYPDGRTAALLDTAHSLSLVDLAQRRRAGPTTDRHDAVRDATIGGSSGSAPTVA